MAILNCGDNMRIIVRFLCLLLAISSLVQTPMAQAQAGQGAQAWYSPAGGLGPFPTAREACYAQWQTFNGAGRIIGDVL